MHRHHEQQILVIRQSSRQPKLHGQSLKSMGIKGRLKHRANFGVPQQRRKQLHCQEIMTHHKQTSTYLRHLNPLHRFGLLTCLFPLQA